MTAKNNLHGSDFSCPVDSFNVSHLMDQAVLFIVNSLDLVLCLLGRCPKRFSLLSLELG